MCGRTHLACFVATVVTFEAHGAGMAASPVMKATDEC